MNALMTIQNVRGYMKDGIAYLNLEDVSRGLGFTDNSKGVQYVRWNTVKGYLAEFGFSQEVAKGGYIPENIFYRLAMKAKNETAEKFQILVADEILPSIRKHGAYLTPQKIEEVLLNPDTIIHLATQLKQEQEERRLLQDKVKADRPKVLFADSVQASHTSILVGELAKIMKQNGIDTGQNRLFQWLRDNGYLVKRKGTDYNMPTQKAMELGLFEIKETTITHSSGHISISKTAKVTGKGQLYFVNKLLDREEAI